MPFSVLPAPISAALAEQGYEAPTPVQAAVLVDEARGRDLLVSAQTGSGKTVAFGLAMAEALLADEESRIDQRAPLALVIAPTRELALQVSRELAWLYGKTPLRVTTCVGGMDASRERRALYQGTQIVVGTPGRLRDHLEHGALDLSALRYAVLDEADEMLDMGFREDLEEILEATPESRRTLLFSATMPKPIAAMAKRYQRDALRVSTVSEQVGHGDIEYQAVAVAPADIERAVVNLLRFHEAETAILFCATRESVRRLHSARGIDIPSLSLVIHVEVPRDAEVLQHRSGRTGRAGRKGIAVLLVPYPRRRRVEGLLRVARVNAQWVPVPSPDVIRERDRERLLTDLAQPVEASEADQATAAKIAETMDPQAIALALVMARKHGFPDPEDLIDAGDGPARPERRAGFEDVVWFRMDIGRRHNADPRWILPLICRRGHITRNEIGAIRIAANETYFQIPSAIEAKFRAAAKRTANPGADDESGITIEVSPEAPKAPRTEGGRDRPTGNRSHHARGDNPGPRDGRPPFKRKGPPRRRD